MVDPAPQITAVSFSGCSWLMTYHLGVAQAINEHFTPQSLTYWGASSGSLTALIMAAGIPPRAAHDYCIDMAKAARKRRLLGPFGRMTSYVVAGLSDLLPPLEEIATERLKVSVTRIRGLRNEVLPKAPPTSREELIRIILASCYIPIYYEKPVFIDGRAYIDGGVSDNLPHADRARTILVSPKPSLQKNACVDIYPQEEPPFKRALFPCRHLLEDLFHQGLADGRSYISKRLTSPRLRKTSPE